MPTSPTTRILSIEDDPYVRSSIVNWLEDSGYEMLEAEDGTSGLATFLEQSPDLVLLDMGLPGMPGQQVLEAIADKAPDTPVVIVSANADISDAIGAFKAGAWDYVTKPILNFGALEQTISNCLERKALQEKVARADARYGALIQNLPVLVVSLDGEGRMTFVNDTCETMTGYPATAALDEPGWLFAHTHEEDLGSLRRAVQGVAEGGAQAETSFRFAHRRGYWLHLTARFFEHDDGTPVVGGVVADATETVFLEKILIQREKLNTLGAVSSELAHEIRNPLMSLGGFARKLTREHPDLPEASIILEQAERLEQLMGRISSYVAPMEVQQQETDIGALLTFCLERLSPSLVRRNLDIRPRLEVGLPVVHTDQDLLTETFVNLLTHLTDDMSDQARLVIQSREIAGHVAVEFILTDPHAPVRVDDPDQLLMPFEEGGGTLELALTHRNMRNLGGNLSISQAEKTLTITVSLPSEKAADVDPTDT